MSKITFRADDELVARLDRFEASKSQVMREALRAYLDGAESAQPADGGGDADAADGGGDADPVDDALAARVDEVIEERLGAFLDGRSGGGHARPGEPAVSLTVNVDGADDRAVSVEEGAATRSESSVDDSRSAGGASRDAESVGDVDADSVGDESAADCVQCGESLDDSHAFCPNCGEKTPERAVCACGDEVRSDWAFCPSCGRRTAAADVVDRR
ncbi:double zinc ribbon domain-containing protein [Halobaculum sp. D14]|uniref:double zinc ribbon domain-containing protein n=1 Tax=Halobaculum sp. D14 TaxID=3421642 RepID=UPI003EC12EA2